MKNDALARRIIYLCEAVDHRLLADDGPVGTFYSGVRPSECDELAVCAYRLAKAHLRPKRRKTARRRSS